MPYIEIHNRSVHVQELNKGASDTLVLVHGMFSNLSVYYFKIAPLLAKRFHVVMYDLKSHGLSTKVESGYRFSHMTEDLIHLLDELKLNKIHLVGYSFGGLVSLNTCMSYPERIEKLCVIEAPNPGDRKAMDLIDVYSKEFLENYIQNFTDTTKVNMGRRQLEKNHRMYEYLFNNTSIKADMEYEMGFFEKAPFHIVNHETLLLYGMRSNCIESGEILSSKIIDSQLKTLEGDHNLPIQQPEIVAETLIEFLTKEKVLF